MPGPDRIAAAASAADDGLPYPSMPVFHTQPGHLASLAALFGIAAPVVDHARVLELGCASGGNIIPLAARYPGASFTGIDLCPRHIADGRRKIAALGLANIALHQGDLAAVRLGAMQFDYVICHGVFSWVPGPAQEAILRLCGQHLAADGVVTISYNVLPGWHLRAVVRDLCLAYAGQDGTPRRRVAGARAALDAIAGLACGDAPYNALLRAEAGRLRTMPAAYILGEFLAADNAPCHVGDFIRRAGQHGLDYLCEADLHASVPQVLDPAMRGQAAALAGPGRAAFEQHLDFLTGRPFRRSVLVRPRSADGGESAPCAGRLRALHIASPLRPDATRGGSGLGVFRDARARTVATADRVVQRAFSRLAAAYPATLTLEALAAPGDADAEARVSAAVLDLVLRGQATASVEQASVEPGPAGPAAGRMPKAWRVARLEAAAGQPWITSLRHRAVPLRPVLAALLPYLDGGHDRAALRARLVAALASGAVQRPAAADAPTEVETWAGQQVEAALAHLARHAVLEADTPAF